VVWRRFREPYGSIDRIESAHLIFPDSELPPSSLPAFPTPAIAIELKLAPGMAPAGLFFASTHDGRRWFCSFPSYFLFFDS
jgi:hypothetical protein